MIVDLQDFNPLVGEVYHTCLLPPEQIKEIHQLVDDRERMVVGVQWCERSKLVKFLMGNFATISVPVSMFPEHLPFEQPWLSDYGFNIFFGEYEVDIREVLFI